eukprot:scaffold45462_cov28-Attheya_sp.AAC.2
MRNVAQVDHPCAALLCAPRKFMEKANESTKQWKYVRNGTSCLVFECKGAEGMKTALEMTSQAAYQELMKDWGWYLDDPNVSKSTAILYLKVKTGATDPYQIEAPEFLYFRAKRMMSPTDDIFKTYPVRPVQNADRVNNYFALMNDRGKRLYKNSSKLKAASFPDNYKALWEQTSNFTKVTKFCHGDIGEHNLLIGPNGEYVLIDWDEACTLHPKPRVTKDTESCLRHLEALRRDIMLYTDFQLALLYCRLKGKYIDSSKNNEWNITSVPVLKKCINSLDGTPEMIVEAVQEAVAKVKEELDIV